jgi:hypothetical protein
MSSHNKFWPIRKVLGSAGRKILARPFTSNPTPSGYSVKGKGNPGGSTPLALSVDQSKYGLTSLLFSCYRQRKQS